MLPNTSLLLKLFYDSKQVEILSAAVFVQQLFLHTLLSIDSSSSPALLELLSYTIFAFLELSFTNSIGRTFDFSSELLLVVFFNYSSASSLAKCFFLLSIELYKFFYLSSMVNSSALCAVSCRLL
ncbi:hypothetical protein Tco_0304311 [Tanacetum coccineum]